ncbi:hypothetical protein [Sphingobacterium sp. xlx-130]|uniref:hypothetical protein n=1 Tax=Sphingobacterium sp. xlx-130 TaxID=2654323 RepID=UPI0013DA042F|nr:hypothetical protein [Sphingobacterium sp. xlx-130]
MADLFVHRAPKSLAVIPFYITAAVFFLGCSILLFISSAELTGHHFNPHILAIVHGLVLGWCTMIIFGAVYQLLPVLCENELYSCKLAFLSYLTLLMGSSMLIYCFWRFHIGPLLIIGGSIVVFSALCFLLNICTTIIKATKSSPYQYFIISSAIWLVLTTSAGLLLAINLVYNFIPRDHLDLLKLHAHAGIVGWFLQLICGVGAKLIPMFLLGKAKRTYLLHAALILQNTGLVLFITHAFFKKIDLVAAIYIALIIIGTLLWCWYIWEAVKTRIRKKIDLLMKQAIYSLYIKLLAVIVLGITFISTESKWITLYGTLIFLGWITGIIISKTFKTLPFIIWNNLYRNIHGNANIPLPKNLYSKKLVTYQTFLFITALLLLCLALLVDRKWLLQVATASWIALALLYCYNVGTVVLHQSKLEK